MPRCVRAAASGVGPRGHSFGAASAASLQAAGVALDPGESRTLVIRRSKNGRGDRGRVMDVSSAYTRSDVPTPDRVYTRKTWPTARAARRSDAGGTSGSRAARVTEARAGSGVGTQAWHCKRRSVGGLGHRRSVGGRRGRAMSPSARPTGVGGAVWRSEARAAVRVTARRCAVARSPRGRSERLGATASGGQRTGVTPLSTTGTTEAEPARAVPVRNRNSGGQRVETLGDRRLAVGGLILVDDALAHGLVQLAGGRAHQGRRLLRIA